MTQQLTTPTQFAIIIGHPRPGSLNHALAHAYSDALVAHGIDRDAIDIIDLAVARPALHPDVTHLRAPNGHIDHLPLEQQEWIETLERAHHIVIFFPNGGAPTREFSKRSSTSPSSPGAHTSMATKSPSNCGKGAQHASS